MSEITPQVRILLFGTGGVGSIYAYILHKGNAHVTTVCRSNYLAVKAHGITINSALFGTVHFNPNEVVSSVPDITSSQIQPYDYIVVCSKWFPNQAQLIKPAVTPHHTTILLCQNGIGIEDDYAALFPTNNLLSGVVYLPTTQTSPGQITMGPLQKLQIGTYPPSSSHDEPSYIAALTLSNIFKAGGGIIELYDDVQRPRWVKLAVNVAWNPTCALTLCDDGNFLRSTPPAELVIRAIMREISDLATAAATAAGHRADYTISEEAIDEQMVRSKQRLDTGGKEPSMLTDVREKRPLEVEAILGNAVRIARQLGVETPRLDLLYVLAGGLSYSIKPDENWKPLGM
jgi:2-dehydropantoate 2-reductase